MPAKARQTVYLLLWIIVLQLSGYLMGMLTEANLDPWYRMLNKSSLTPPDIVFGIVWPILYILLAVVGWCLKRAVQYKVV